MAQFKTVETAETAARLIADLERTIDLLKAEIAAEERRLQKFNPAGIDYPFLARTWTERCNNLRATIAFMEGHQAPPWERAA